VRALIYDVHGNLPALEAVVDDALAAGADGFLLGGDYGLFGPWPAETVAKLRVLPNATWIRGNVDRWSAHPDEAPHGELIQASIDACRQALGEQVVSELGALSEQLVIEGTRYCHGSPISDLRSFMPSGAENDDELLGGVPEPRVVFGHTHLQFSRRTASGIELVNPGSAGMPFDGDPRAAYALLHDEGQITPRRVSYDHEASAAAAEERYPGAAWAGRSARRLRQAQMCD
jgi:diadenosine tetraphosphatase ApaH/serine/threonine PP2A family protein phosphatase